VGYWAGRKGGRGLDVRRGRGVHDDARVVRAGGSGGTHLTGGTDLTGESGRANGKPELTRGARRTERETRRVRGENRCRQSSPTGQREGERERACAAIADRWDPPVRRSGCARPGWAGLGLMGRIPFFFLQGFSNCFYFYFLYGFQIKFKPNSNSNNFKHVHQTKL
jgi:hypothetical protein